MSGFKILIIILAIELIPVETEKLHISGERTEVITSNYHQTWIPRPLLGQALLRYLCTISKERIYIISFGALHRNLFMNSVRKQCE